MLNEIKSKSFANGSVYLMETTDGFPLEVTDTFLPFYTKNAVGKHQNTLSSECLGSRNERWMIGVSTMSGCPVGCKFCATGQLKRCRNLSSSEIVDQVMRMVSKQSHETIEHLLYSGEQKEFKINYTRMGEPFLNIENVKEAISNIDEMFRGVNVHHYISTIGVKDSDFSWIKDNVSLQFSIHSFEDDYRNWLIPFKKKMTLQEIGQVRTKSNLKTTLNLTLTRPQDFDINKLKEYFDPEYFFVKLSPINPNEISSKNGLDNSVIHEVNVL